MIWWKLDCPALSQVAFAHLFHNKRLYLESLRVVKSDFGIKVLTFAACQVINLSHFSNKVKFSYFCLCLVSRNFWSLTSGVSSSTPWERPEVLICTPMWEEEHPRPFHMGVPQLDILLQALSWWCGSVREAQQVNNPSSNLYFIYLRLRSESRAQAWVP